jgi:hypothetical protein
MAQQGGTSTVLHLLMDGTMECSCVGNGEESPSIINVLKAVHMVRFKPGHYGQATW